MWMTGQDIYHCFNEMRHEMVVPSLWLIDKPWWLCWAIYREYMQLEADAEVLGAPRTGTFGIGRGGITGRALTPAVLKSQMRAAFEPLAQLGSAMIWHSPVERPLEMWRSARTSHPNAHLVGRQLLVVRGKPQNHWQSCCRRRRRRWNLWV